MESPEEYSTAQISVSGNDAVASSDEILSIMVHPLTPDPPAAACCVNEKCLFIMKRPLYSSCPNDRIMLSLSLSLSLSLYIYIYIYIYRVSQEECARLRENVPYVKVYRYNPKHLCPKLNGYGDNGQRSLKL